MPSSGEDFLPAPFLHAVLEPRLHDLQARDFKNEDLGRYGAELTAADVERLRRFIIGERTGVALFVTGDGLCALGRATRDLAKPLAFRDEALAVGVQPEQSRSNVADPAEKRCVLRDRHAQFTRLQFLCIKRRETRLRQQAIYVGQEVLRCHLAPIGTTKQVEQAGEEIGLCRVSVAVKGKGFLGSVRPAKVVEIGNESARSHGGARPKGMIEETRQIHLPFAVGAPEVGAWSRHQAPIGNNGLPVK